ncbi:hypothetical protein OK414_29460 [Priestia sp. JV24]|uniref:hypothetical protein n=1 Tax=Priestia TaxID=2800373 RepID=UPI0021D66332|nr:MULTISPECIES: hypothetical protein [Priestia]MCU7713075.1 hypothetical protein [Priestia megaterium]MCW1049183.1 hypothetical protein [Priestia sp. JV24]
MRRNFYNKARQAEITKASIGSKKAEIQHLSVHLENQLDKVERLRVAYEHAQRKGNSEQLHCAKTAYERSREKAEQHRKVIEGYRRSIERLEVQL